MDKAQAELQALFDSMGIDQIEQSIIIPDIKKMLLESYRNGQKAGAQPKRSAPAGKSAQAAPAECIYDHDHAKNHGRDCASHD
jgi:hypothetical protein